MPAMPAPRMITRVPRPELRGKLRRPGVGRRNGEKPHRSHGAVGGGDAARAAYEIDQAPPRELRMRRALGHVDGSFRWRLRALQLGTVACAVVPCRCGKIGTPRR